MEDLAGLLGLDIPSPPIIDLASVKADGAIIHWSLSEKHKHKSTFKFEIHLNGTLVDTLSVHETAATITGLQPASFHVVRISLVNNFEFSSKSDPIRFRTKPASSGDFFVAITDGNDSDNDAPHESVTRVQPHCGLKDVIPMPTDGIPMARECSASLSSRRSTIAGRRPSPAVIGADKHDLASDEVDPLEGVDTIQQLTAKLDAIRRETDAAENLAREDEEDELRQKEELIKERDELKSEVTEKERASRNLKREVNILERQNTAAQNERTKHDRMLQMKKQERQKLKDDIIRWEKEAEEMKFDVEKIQQDKVDLLQQAEEEKEALRNRQADESVSIKALDDEVKEKTSEVKKLERAIKTNSPNASEPELSLVQQLQLDTEEKRAWDMHYGALQQHYAMAAQKLEQAKRLYAEQVNFLEAVRARRRQEEAANYTSPSPTQDPIPHKASSQRSRRAQSGHSSSESPRLASFPASTSAFAPSLNSTASPFPGAPFLNIQNGMTISGPTDEVVMSDEEKERLTGGALMSPGAGADLLPADLFYDADNKQTTDMIQPLPGLGSLPGLPGALGPTGVPYQDSPGQKPSSPVSVSSRPASIFASPQASQQNLHLGSPEHMIDPDRRSIRSTRSNRATSGSGTGSRFSGMFGIKHRAKQTAADEGPALGKAQSHSMPREDQGIPGLDSATRKRNSSISDSIYQTAFGREGAYDGPSEAPAAATRRRAFNIFGNKGDGWPSTFTSFGRRPASPRPVSTHSNELPRPSMDSSRWGVDNWPSGDGAGAARSSPLSFGPGWNPPSSQPSRMYGSRLPSRRASIQYAASGPPEDIMEDDDSDALNPNEAPHLAPIGTRPVTGTKKSDKPTTSDGPKLNPNAKDFKSFFASMKLRDKDKLKDGGPSASTPPAINTPNPDWADNEDSPPASRKSRDTRDTHSMTTTDSSTAGSGRNSPDLARSSSYSNSEALAPSPLLSGSATGKESFMSKLTRKSSSSKFSLPTFKREKSRLDPSATPTSVTSAPAEDDEDSMSASAGSLREREPRESKEGTRGSGRNWSNVLKIGKKKGTETPSLSGLSVASGTEDDEEAEEEMVY